MGIPRGSGEILLRAATDSRENVLVVVLDTMMVGAPTMAICNTPSVIFSGQLRWITQQ
jgi:hypothetical protein